MSEPYLYLVMRGDMPSMNPGKLAAQAAHGASMFHEYAHRFGDNEVSQPWYILYLEWVRQARDFGTTIVLTATHQEIDDLEAKADNYDLKKLFVSDTIVDPSYPFTMETEIYNYVRDATEEGFMFENVSDLGNGRTFATRSETTGLWIFGDKEILKPYLGHLKLYP